MNKSQRASDAFTSGDPGSAVAAKKPQRWKLHLEDHDQDFLWFVVEGNTVIEAGPFQNWVWAGKQFQQPKKWQRGSRIVWADGRVLKYPVTKATRI